LNKWLDVPSSPLIVYTLEGVIKKDVEEPVEINIDPPSPIFSLALSTAEELRDIHVHYVFTGDINEVDLRPTIEAIPEVTSYHSFVAAMNSDTVHYQPFLFVSLPTGSSPMVRNIRIDTSYIEVNYPLISKVTIWFDEVRPVADVPFRYCIGALGM
jgi:hypothetical protein